MNAPTRLTTQQEKLVEELFDAFCERDYPECLTKVFDLGMTLGGRYFTPILSMGINFEIDRQPSLQISLIYTVASLRLGDRMGAESPFAMNAMAGGSIRHWLVTLSGLLLQHTSFDDVLKCGQTEAQRLQAFYYHGESKVTDRNYPDALLLFGKCIEIPAHCPEQRFAEARIRWLQGGNLPS